MSPTNYGGVPTAPPGPVGTPQGAVKPDVPVFKIRLLKPIKLFPKK